MTYASCPEIRQSNLVMVPYFNCKYTRGGTTRKCEGGIKICQEVEQAIVVENCPDSFCFSGEVETVYLSLAVHH